MTNPQRVDVERFDPCISRERSDARHVYPTPDMEHAAFGEYVKYEDYAALLQQLAEAERAREEACAIFAEVIDTVRDAATDARMNHHAKRGEYHDEMADRIAAFLAANGEQDHG